MLLCTLDELEVGMIVGAAVPHPARSDLRLIAPDVPLTAELIRALRRHEIPRVWIRHAGTEDIDGQTHARLSEHQRAIGGMVKSAFESAASLVVSTAGLYRVRGAVMQLICDLMGNRRLAGLASRMHARSDRLFTHGANVAYLSILIGLELETYLVRERPRMKHSHAVDLTPLGIAATFHDAGKLRLQAQERDVHEVLLGGREPPEGYADHVELSRRALAATRAPASALQAILNHHQRFDGTGWPALKRARFEHPRPLRAREPHVFARVLAAANALDSLLVDAESRGRPPVEALALFASERFDGWFDPVIRRTALGVVAPFPVGTPVVLSDDRRAVVAEPCRADPCNPVVRPLDDPTAPPIELRSEPALSIVRCAGHEVGDMLYSLPPVPEQPAPDESDVGIIYEERDDPPGAVA